MFTTCTQHLPTRKCRKFPKSGFESVFWCLVWLLSPLWIRYWRQNDVTCFELWTSSRRLAARRIRWPQVLNKTWTRSWYTWYISISDTTALFTFLGMAPVLTVLHQEQCRPTVLPSFGSSPTEVARSSLVTSEWLQRITCHTCCSIRVPLGNYSSGTIS